MLCLLMMLTILSLKTIPLLNSMTSPIKMHPLPPLLASLFMDQTIDQYNMKMQLKYQLKMIHLIFLSHTQQKSQQQWAKEHIKSVHQ